MALNGIHLCAVLDAPLQADDIPQEIVADWGKLVMKWKEFSEDDRTLAAQTVERVARIRIGKPDPYPELVETEPTPLEL